MRSYGGTRVGRAENVSVAAAQYVGTPKTRTRWLSGELDEEIPPFPEAQHAVSVPKLNRSRGPRSEKIFPKRSFQNTQQQPELLIRVNLD
mmetsp:Transcript_129/g.227  ORF Transcript_129/g.227 Transcript_129/m.227 type:complete len:90 (+) Transcript_129:127-396(+)